MVVMLMMVDEDDDDDDDDNNTHFPPAPRPRANRSPNPETYCFDKDWREQFIFSLKLGGNKIISLMEEILHQ